jgi:predicted RNase H-like HicB family nuclease
MHRFLAVIEKANGNYSAYSPGVAGCVATGDTREAAEQHMRDALRIHLRGLLEDGLPIHQSESSAEYIDVP